MKVVFLDMDGVVNHDSFFQAQTAIYSQQIKDGIIVDEGVSELRMLVHPELVARVNQITTATDAKIVWSSSWRIHFMADLDLAQDFLWSVGFVTSLVGITPQNGTHPSFPGHCRGNQIQNWLDDHPEVTNFIILDDDSDMGALRDHLIKTSWYDTPEKPGGIQDHHVAEAITRLNDPNGR